MNIIETSSETKPLRNLLNRILPGFVVVEVEVDQAECLRRGIERPKSIGTIQITSSKMSQAHRDLVADRLDGIDVCELTVKKANEDGNCYGVEMAALRAALEKTDAPMAESVMVSKCDRKNNGGQPTLIFAKAPMYMALIEACEMDANKTSKMIQDWGLPVRS